VFCHAAINQKGSIDEYETKYISEFFKKTFFRKKFKSIVNKLYECIHYNSNGVPNDQLENYYKEIQNRFEKIGVKFERIKETEDFDHPAVLKGVYSLLKLVDNEI